MRNALGRAKGIIVFPNKKKALFLRFILALFTLFVLITNALYIGKETEEN